MFTDKYGRGFVFVRLPQVGLLPNSHMKAAVEAVNTLEKKRITELYWCKLQSNNKNVHQNNEKQGVTVEVCTNIDKENL